MIPLLRRSRPLVLSLVAWLLSPTVGAQCSDWSPGFGEPGTNGAITCAAIYPPPGFGAPKLYVGGGFTTAGGVTVSRLAAWDGVNWSAPSIGPAWTVHAMCVFDDGSGPKLIVAGEFNQVGSVAANKIAQFDGTTWSTLGTGASNGVSGGNVFALETDGTALYVAGSFTTAGGNAVFRIARWDGASWSSLPGGGPGNGTIRALRFFDPGTGPQLFAAGDFTQVGVNGTGTNASRIARWDGATWTSVSMGSSQGVDGNVDALEVFDDGSGDALYLGGTFGNAAGISASRIARWNGLTFTAVSGGTNGRVRALEAHGSELYVGGSFSTVDGGLVANRAATWNGQFWSAVGTTPVGGGMPGSVEVLRFVAADLGDGMKIHATGNFPQAGTRRAMNIAAWDGANWSQLGEGANATVRAITSIDLGTGPELYAGGDFTGIGGAQATRIARFTPNGWQPLGSGGPDSTVLKILSLGSSSVFGPVVVAGSFSNVSGLAAWRLARWNGTTWSSLGPVNAPGANGTVKAVVEYTDSVGPALYAGGDFTIVGGVPASKIARWNGVAWSALPGVTGNGVNGSVEALAVAPNSIGAPTLYVGGSFTQASGTTVNHIATWNGTAWSALPVGLDGTVYAMTTFDAGTGVALYVAGAFTANATSTQTLNRVARWDGSNWSFVNTGITSGNVFHLEAFDDGSGGGPALYAAGDFTTSSGALHVVKLAASGPASLGSSTNGAVYALAAHGAGTGDLFAGGSFTSAGAYAASRVAKWTSCHPSGTPFCFGDGTGSPCPCGNLSAIGAESGCLNSIGIGGRLTASGAASLAADTLVLQGTQMTNSTAIYAQGTSRDNGGLGTPAGDGLRCFGGAIVRLGIKTNSGGGSQFPGPTDLSLSVRGGVLVPGVRVYQVYYRNANATFCPPATYNFTNGWEVAWAP